MYEELEMERLVEASKKRQKEIEERIDGERIVSTSSYPGPQRCTTLQISVSVVGCLQQGWRQRNAVNVEHLTFDEHIEIIRLTTKYTVSVKLKHKSLIYV